MFRELLRRKGEISLNFNKKMKMISSFMGELVWIDHGCLNYTLSTFVRTSWDLVQFGQIFFFHWNLFWWFWSELAAGLIATSVSWNLYYIWRCVELVEVVIKKWEAQQQLFRRSRKVVSHRNVIRKVHWRHRFVSKWAAQAVKERSKSTAKAAVDVNRIQKKKIQRGSYVCPRE